MRRLSFFNESKRKFRNYFALLTLALIFITALALNCAPTGPTTDDGTTTNPTTTTSIVTVTSIIEAGGTTSIVVVTSIVYDTTTTTLATTTTTTIDGRNILPVNFMVDIPKSLLPTLSSLASTSSSTLLSSVTNLLTRSLKRSTTRAPEDNVVTSMGYESLKMVIGWIVEENKTLTKQFILTDELIKDMSSDWPGYHEETEIIYTQAMADEINALAGEFDYPVTEGDYEFFPKFKYVNSSCYGAAEIDQYIVDKDYDNVVFLDFMASYELPYYTYILWDDDKSDVCIIYNYDDPDQPMQIEVYYDAVNKISSMFWISESYPWEWSDAANDYIEDWSQPKEKSLYVVTMQETDDANDGVIIDSFSRNTGKDFMTNEPIEYTYSINGYADNNGGYCETDYTQVFLNKTDDFGLFGSSDNFRYRDIFDGNGYLISEQFFDTETEDGDGVGWETIDLDGDGYIALDEEWDDASLYVDEYSTNYETFDSTIESTGLQTIVDQTINENISETSDSTTDVIPTKQVVNVPISQEQIIWDTTTNEVKKTFAITNDNTPPKLDGSNVIGYQTVYKDDSASTAATEVSFVVEGAGDIANTSMNIYEVVYTSVNLGVNAVKNIEVKSVVEAISDSSGNFSLIGSGFTQNVPGVQTMNVKLPTLTGTSDITNPDNWGADEMEKLVVLTNDGNPPLPDGSNVAGMKKIPKDFCTTNPTEPKVINLATNDGELNSDYGMYVLNQDTPADPSYGQPAVYDTDYPLIETPIVIDPEGSGNFTGNGDDGLPETFPTTTISIVTTTLPAVTTTTAAGATTTSSTTTTTIQLTAPTGVQASTNYSDKIVVTWSPVNGAYEYKVFVSINAGPHAYYGDASGTSKNYSKPSTHTSTNTYNFYVKAITEYGILGPESSASNGGKFAELLTPSLTSATQDKSDMISLAWGAVTGATSYYVYRSDAAIVQYDKIATVDTLNHDDKSGLEAGKEYYYKIKAVDANGESAFSNEKIGKLVKPAVQPDGPPVKSVTNNAYEKTTIFWDPIAGATYYDIYRAGYVDPTTDGKWVKIDRYVSESIFSYDDETVPPGVTYAYRIVAGVNGSETKPGAWWYAYSHKLDPVSWPTASDKDANVAPGKIKISWAWIEGAERYEIWRAEGSQTATYSKIGTTDPTGFTPIIYEDGTVQAGVQYFYKIATVRIYKDGKEYRAIDETKIDGGEALPPNPTSLTIAFETEGSSGGYITWIGIDWNVVLSMDCWHDYDDGVMKFKDGYPRDKNSSAGAGGKAWYFYGRSYDKSWNVKIAVKLKDGTTFESNTVTVPKYGP